MIVFGLRLTQSFFWGGGRGARSAGGRDNDGGREARPHHNTGRSTRQAPSRGRAKRSDGELAKAAEPPSQGHRRARSANQRHCRAGRAHSLTEDNPSRAGQEQKRRNASAVGARRRRSRKRSAADGKALRNPSGSDSLFTPPRPRGGAQDEGGAVRLGGEGRPHAERRSPPPDRAQAHRIWRAGEGRRGANCPVTEWGARGAAATSLIAPP